MPGSDVSDDVPAPDFSPAGCLDRYRHLRRCRPELFGPRPDGAITLVEDDCAIARAVDQARRHRAAAGLSHDDVRVGVLAADPYSMLVRDPVAFPDGRLGTYHRLIVPPGVVILPIVSEAAVALIRIFRHPLGRWVWETPRGYIDAGETPVQAAGRELAEETGAVAGDLIDLGPVFTTSGLSPEQHHLFAARIDRVGEPERAEAISQIRLVPVSDLGRLARDGELGDASSLAAILRAALRGLIALG